MIPALHDAQFLRYGVMHRNTYLDSPRLLDRYYRLRGEERISFAGQITGVEGYVESCASGFLVGVETARRLQGKAPIDFPQETAIGALGLYVSNESVGVVPADEHQLRHHAAAGLPREGQAQQERGACRSARSRKSGQLRGGGAHQVKIIVDAMGGDNAPLEIVKGALQGRARWGVDIVLTGDAAQILRAAGGMRRKDRAAGCGASPTRRRPSRCATTRPRVFRHKKDTSMGVGLHDAARRQGATRSSPLARPGRSSRARRSLPSACAVSAARQWPPLSPPTTGRAVLIDCGANAECTPEYLVQFAYLGNFYAKRVLGIGTPRVAPAQHRRGGQQGHRPAEADARAPAAEADAAGHLHFIGNIEAKEAIKGGCDVIVTDGFSGNILLKTHGGRGFVRGQRAQGDVQEEPPDKARGARW